MTENRYRYDTGSIIDQKTGEILTLRKTVIRLNKQDAIIRQRTKQLEATIKQLNKEIDNADGELKQALIRISHKELHYD